MVSRVYPRYVNSSPQMVDDTLITFVGTSLINQGNSATSASVNSDTRGWFNWAANLSNQKFKVPVWQDLRVLEGWEPSQTPGATRNFWGLNMGVSGQTAQLIYDRREVVAASRAKYYVLDMGTNDIGSVDKEDIQDLREQMTNYLTSFGKTVILLPILARDTSVWPSGGSQREDANYINNKTREFVNQNENVLFFDWNDSFVDFEDADGNPKTGYSIDGTHFDTEGAYFVGKAFANFIDSLFVPASNLIGTVDNTFDAVNNPKGIISPNPFCRGTGGSTTNASGDVADDWVVQRTTGAATVVASKESTDRGELQVITITPPGTSGNSTILFRTSPSDTTHNSAGEWIEATAYIEQTSDNTNQSLTELVLYLRDQDGGELVLARDGNNTGSNMVSEPFAGTFKTPMQQLASDSTVCRFRIEIEIDDAQTDPIVIKIGQLGVRRVEDPNTQFGTTLN